MTTEQKNMELMQTLDDAVKRSAVSASFGTANGSVLTW
jgi:hypothetical protein